jgi:Helix-turn-helix
VSCTKSSCDIVVKSAMRGQTGRESGMGRTKGSGSARREAPGAKAAERATQALLVLFGENFYQARVQAGLTQIDIEAHGIKQAYISQIEGGRENPTLATLTILALAVGEDVRARDGRLSIQPYDYHCFPWKSCRSVFDEEFVCFDRGCLTSGALICRIVRSSIQRLRKLTQGNSSDATT